MIVSGAPVVGSGVICAPAGGQVGRSEPWQFLEIWPQK